MSFSASRVAQDPESLARIAELCASSFDLFLEDIVTASEHLVPNEPQDIVTWALENLIIPTEVSDRSGPLVFAPLQAALVRLTQEMMTRQVTFQKPPRIGSSLMTAAMMLYFAVHEGQPVIYYERSDGVAQDFHDKFLYPIMCASPTVAKLMRPRTKAGVQDAWSDIILTNGAPIQLRSASNNGNFRSIKASKIFADEISSKEWLDRSKDGEGNKLGLIWPRMQQFAQPLLYSGSTPTKAGFCAISMEYQRSDKRT